MRNEKNPDASRMVFPGMLDGVGINPIVAKRFGIQMSPSFWIWQVPDGNCSGSTTMHYYVQESRCLAQRSRRKTGLICAACVPTKSTKGKQMRRTVSRILTGNAL